jgi:acyl-CoA synthetase (NDP forming)
MLPARAVRTAVQQCVERGIPLATIYTDGFAEAGAGGRRAQEELVEIARQGGVRLVGPNCSGIYSTVPTCALSVNSALERLNIRPGPLAIVSQSGSMTGGLVSRGLSRGVGFSRIVSIGNEADLSIAEIVDMLVEDKQTGAVLLFLESVRDASRLALAARRATRAGKPVIAYKLGRSEVGRELAASHTGAMVGADTVVDAFFRANGILRVDNLEALFELPALLAGQQPDGKKRVAVMSTTGGGAALVVDRLGTVGVDVVAPSDQVVDKLAARGISITRARLTDLTHAGTRADVYGPVLEELLDSDHCDLVVAVAGSSAQFQPEATVEPVINARRDDKPLAVFIAPHAPESLQRLADAGVAGFRTPESCVDAIRAWAQWRPPRDPQSGDRDRIEEAKGLLSSREGTLDERESSRVFAALGIPVARAEVIRDPSDRVQLEFPVVAKVLSADVIHKSDAGGVVLGVPDAPSLKLAATQILARIQTRHPQARVNGILVQQMETGLAEVIVGFRHDPQVGPVVVLGVGGILAEVYHDLAVRLAPVELSDARTMIDEVRGLAPLTGYRGHPRGDTEALAQAITAMSQIAEIDGPTTVAEAEINPLLVRNENEGVVAVDGLIALATPAH